MSAAPQVDISFLIQHLPAEDIQLWEALKKLVSGVNDALNQTQVVPSSNPTGPAGGDLSGTYPNPTVAKIEGRAVSSAAPNDGDLLTWVNADGQWEPKPASGGSSGTSTIDFHVLSSNLAITPSVHPAPANSLLVVILQQNSTGGWVVSWDGNFTITPSALSTLPNTYSAVLFGAHAGAWMMIAPPMTGRL